jgi:aminoglycoside phosphotransferase (APT) family kinase protein
VRAVIDRHAADSLRAAHAALERVLPGGAAKGATLESLAGGINRRSYLVTAGAQQWVLRLPTPGAEGLLDLATEANVMRAAAAAGLAPAVAGADPERGILLTDYRAAARSWTVADARDGANVVRIAALLRQLHAVAANAPAYAAERIARKYLAALSAGVDTRRKPLDTRSRAWADELL